MMIELIRNRRSVRKYKDKSIEAEKQAILKESLLRSPTSRNFKPCEFVFVDSSELLAKLAEAKKHGAGFLSGAPLAIVVCANDSKSDVWVEDCSIASILVQMVASEMGLGSCWVQIRKRETADGISSEKCVREVLSLPENIRVLSIIAIGYPDESKEAIKASELDYTKIKSNTYR